MSVHRLQKSDEKKIGSGIVLLATDDDDITTLGVVISVGVYVGFLFIGATSMCFSRSFDAYVVQSKATV